MASLQQIQKFRLQKSPHMRKHAHSMNDLRFRFKVPEVEAYDNEKTYQDASVDFKSMPQRNNISNDKNESGRLRKLFSRMKRRTSQNLQKEIEIEPDYSSNDEENENVNEYNIEYYFAGNAQKSRELYARYVKYK